MAASGSDAGAPNLNLTSDEKRVYGQLFRQADTDNVGVVTGEIAVKFFDKTRLDSAVLGEIWQIADKENRGFLTPAGFGIVLRLIGHAQAGRVPTAELALQHGPLPRFDGISIPPAPVPAAPAAPAPPAVLQAQVTGGAPIRIPPLTPEKVAQYANLFEHQPLQGNLLPGEQAKSIFEKSGLPNETLGRIWMLADTEGRGALVQTEFVIAMHLLTSMKSGALRGLPTILPAALYEAATRRAPVGGIPRPPTSPTGVPAPISAIPRQLSGQAPLTQMRTGTPLGRSPLAPQTTGGNWLVTPADKSRFDQIYNELDKGSKGYITGEEAVNFFGQSKLPSETLAQIWDLVDIKSEGILNKDEFAVAMYLIRQQRSKPDGSIPLPATLPPNLIPPSLRTQIRSPLPTVSAFDPPAPPPQPQPKPSAMDDLFGLDDPPPAPAPAAAAPTPAPQQVAVGTGGSNANDPFASSISPAPSSPIRPTATGTVFKPFIPSSSFGRGLTANVTGGSTGSGASSVKPTPLPPTIEDDLLGDNDDSSNAMINNDATELANLSNQIGSLTKQVQDVQTQRTTTQNELSQSTAQKKNFEQRLAQLRTLYEKEAEAVRSLEQQLTVSKAETRKLQTEILTLSTSYQDLQNQHQTVLAALQADQQENAALKQKISATNTEIAQLKPQVEKLRSDARQQKGLVAINKKQLATNEGEREKLKTEVSDLTKENEELARQLSSSPPPQMSSPALSTTSANNPFFKRSQSTDVAGVFSSIPSVKSFNDKSFDDVFGPTSTPPPAASALFAAPQNTGTSTASVGSFATPTSTTPTVSRQATVDVPPPPPESRQLSSTNLPFVDPAESLSSSRQVSPPLSRVSPETPAAEPTLAPALEIAPSTTSLASASGSESTKQPASPPPVVPTSNGTSAFFDEPATEEATKADVSADPFGAINEETKAKEDFEAAFASFKSANSSSKDTGATGFPPAPTGDSSNNAFSKFDSEFPPISELERAEEESDSEDELAGGAGFDDDFTPASPPPTKPTETKEVEAPAAEEASAAEVAAPVEKPASPVTDVHNITGSNVDDVFGSAALAPAAPITTQAAAPATLKAAFDDLDDDFEGLEDAKEGSADDDFANISRDDFNAVFDSSPPPSQFPKSQDSSHNTTSSQAPFGTESSFDFASLSSASAAGSATAVPTNATATAPAPATGAAASAPKPESHDWDAIFASLDDAPAAAAMSPTATVGNGSLKEPARPDPPGREDSTQDDPILKNLTSMGYSRTDALSALEKYDYNLERAANYLANSS